MKKISAEKLELIYCQNQMEMMRSTLEIIALKKYKNKTAQYFAIRCLSLLDSQNYEKTNY